MKMKQHAGRPMIKLEDRVMEQVHDAWLFRKIRGALAVRFIAIGTVAVIMGFYISYHDVLQNLATTGWQLSSVGTYVADAFSKTEFVVKALLALGGLLSVMLLWDAGRFVGFLATRIFGSREQVIARIRR